MGTYRNIVVGLERDIAIELSRDHLPFIVSANGSFSLTEVQFLSIVSSKTRVLGYAVGK
jgi:hypothetical protein